MSFPDPLPLETPLPDPSRSLDGCPHVIFIAYTVSADTIARGYEAWLCEVDMPFFNAIPGTRHYANWRLTEVLRGEPQAWDWFDFQGLTSASDLEGVWFHPLLDAFRKGWLGLWGYGEGTPPPVLRHAYLMEPVGLQARDTTSQVATLSAGRGAPPKDATADAIYRVSGVLHKHFGGRDPERPWLSDAASYNPLGFDWIAVDWRVAPPVDGAEFAARAALVAAPDRPLPGQAR